MRPDPTPHNFRKIRIMLRDNSYYDSIFSVESTQRNIVSGDLIYQMDSQKVSDTMHTVKLYEKFSPSEGINTTPSHKINIENHVYTTE